MLCALRKVLAKLSNENSNGCRYYIADNQVQIVSAPTAPTAKDGEAKTYFARGRCKLGVTHGTHITTKMIEFSITYRDCKDSLGLDDVEFIDPTSIDELPKSTALA